MDKLNLQAAYTHWVNRAKLSMPKGAAMKQAIGGQFEAYGIIQVEMLKHYGLQPEGTLIDVGCGSGRTAIPLSKSHTGKYVGIDLVPDLVAHARDNCGRPDWTFKVVNGLTIPAKDKSADMVCFFSVLTHLLHEQSYLYLQEAQRVLRPGGKIVLSFLEFRMGFHWPVFDKTVADARGGGNHPLNVFIDRHALEAWADHLGLKIEEFRDGDDAFVPLPAPVTLDNGMVLENFGNLGQSICVMVRP